MEITRSNYEALLPEIIEKIKASTFVCFDAEFSGLGQSAGEPKTSLFDGGAERYKKMRNICQTNTTPQVGFCIFRKENRDDSNVFYVDAYQAYVTQPRFADFNTQNEIAFSLEYKCSKFLRKCSFDFNAFHETSVPFLNDVKMDQLKKYLAENPDFMQKNQGRYFDKVYFPNNPIAFGAKDAEKLEKKLRGLSEIVDVLREYKIPIVGHNVALDLLYFFQMFCTDLPSNYEQFKMEIRKYLPHVYDTKYMTIDVKRTLNNHPAFRNNLDKNKLKGSSLFAAYQTTSMVNEKFAAQIKLGLSCSHFEKSLHYGRIVDLEEAQNQLVHCPGFDACVTGILFLNISHIAARIDKNFSNRTHPPTQSEMFDNVQSWKDQIFICRAAVSAINLGGNDPRPSRPRWNEVSRNGEKIDFEAIKASLVEIGFVDVVQIDDKVLRFAPGGGKNARTMKAMLAKQGYNLKPVNIPYNKTNYKVTEPIRPADTVYDKPKLLG